MLSSYLSYKETNPSPEEKSFEEDNDYYADVNMDRVLHSSDLPVRKLLFQTDQKIKREREEALKAQNESKQIKPFDENLPERTPPQNQNTREKKESVFGETENYQNILKKIELEKDNIFYSSVTKTAKKVDEWMNNRKQSKPSKKASESRNNSNSILRLNSKDSKKSTDSQQSKNHKIHLSLNAVESNKPSILHKEINLKDYHTEHCKKQESSSRRNSRSSKEENTEEAERAPSTNRNRIGKNRDNSRHNSRDSNKNPNAKKMKYINIRDLETQNILMKNRSRNIYANVKNVHSDHVRNQYPQHLLLNPPVSHSLYVSQSIRKPPLAKYRGNGNGGRQKLVQVFFVLFFYLCRFLE
jgi:hypothetical protein